jgi:hypothetical protein
MKNLEYYPKISLKRSEEMIFMMARWGNNTHGINDIEKVPSFYDQRGIKFKEIVEKCRNWPEPVPIFENLIGPTWRVSNASLSRINLSTGKTIFSVEGEGEFISSTYWSLFCEAEDNISKAIKENSFTAFQTAIINGIAALEAYINAKAIEWNETHPNGKKIDINAKISFDEKIEQWIPIMGRPMSKNTKFWSNFKELRKVRDNQTVHPKNIGSGRTIAELAQCINQYRSGIAGLLCLLHFHIGERIPCAIIRRYYSPDAVVTVSKDMI